MTLQFSPGPREFSTLGSADLRSSFLLTDLFTPNSVQLRFTDLDRAVVGGAMPTASAVELPNPEQLRSAFFAERRELGVLNIGGSGTIQVDGTDFRLENRDVLYVGRGAKSVSFASADAGSPAKFYIISYPAHQEYPTSLVRAADTMRTDLGSDEQANKRSIYRYIHLEGVLSSQLVMGVTVLDKGSVWNTMPSHTHFRRTEVYLYFDLPKDAFVVHLLGEPGETRHVLVRDAEVALSPGWSIHSGCGTSNYAFCWAMGGENQDYTDMSPVGMQTLR